MRGSLVRYVTAVPRSRYGILQKVAQSWGVITRTYAKHAPAQAAAECRLIWAWTVDDPWLLGEALLKDFGEPGSGGGGYLGSFLNRKGKTFWKMSHEPPDAAGHAPSGPQGRQGSH